MAVGAVQLTIALQLPLVLSTEILVGHPLITGLVASPDVVTICGLNTYSEGSKNPSVSSKPMTRLGGFGSTN